MSRITEYTSVSAFDENDVLIKDGENGTKIISVEDAAAEFRRLCGINGDISGITDSLSAFGTNLAGVETTFIATKNYNIGDLFVIDNVLYRATATIASGSEIDPETNCEETSFSTVIEAMNDILAGKADANGTYDNLIAGSAKQLVGTVFTEDDAAYTFRTSGGSADIGDREYDEIVGGSIVWNQIQPNTISRSASGIEFTYNNGSLHISGTTTNQSFWLQASGNKVPIYQNHVYLVDVGNSDYEGNINTGYWYIPLPTTINVYTPTMIFKYSNETFDSYMQFHIRNTDVEIDITFKPQLFDLTQMFGSEIADYIYSLETATAGAGVAWFRKYFPKDYYEYNPGEIMPVEGLTSHDMVSFNAWDEEWEVGSILESSGDNTTNVTDVIRSKNYIPVIPNTVYACTYGNGDKIYELFYYDANKHYLGFETLPSTGIITTPLNCTFMRFRCRTSYGTTYNHDICINLSWDGERDGEYEPYVKHSYPLDSSLTLRGIPKLSTDGKLYYDGDHYKPDGTVERRYGTYTFTGDESVDMQSYVNRRDQSITSVGYFVTIPNLQNTKKALLVNDAGYDLGIESPVNYRQAVEWSYKDKTVVNILTSNVNKVMFRNDTIGSVEQFIADITGKTIVYELAEPTTEEAQPFQSPQIVDDFGTEEYVTSSIVPVGHITQYDSNLRAKLEMAPNSPDGDGDYLVRQTGGQNEYVPYTDGGRITSLEGKIPTPPSTDGTYVLKCTVADGTPTYSWVSA